MDNLRDVAFSFADIAQNLNENLLRPWIAYQIAIAIGVFVVAYFLTTSLKARFQNWIRARSWQTWRMRIFVMLHRRLLLLVYVVLIWITLLVKREIT